MVRLISKQEVAQRLGFHPEHVMRLARQDSLFPRPIKFGSSPGAAVRFDAAEIDVFIEQRKAASSKGVV